MRLLTSLFILLIKPPKSLKIKGGRHLEAFSIQLIVLATWKQAIHICNSYAASSARESPSHDINMADDESMQIERQFLIAVEYAEELASTVGQIPGTIPCLGP
jgi:serine/threonine-protein kinase ULK/ATG1